MNDKKGPIIPFGIITLVLGGAILEQFDFESQSFEKPVLAVVYILTLLMTVFFLGKSFKGK